jgi:hypothetical protein
MESGILAGIEEISMEEAKRHGMLAGLVSVEVRTHRVKTSGHWLDKLTYAYRLEDCGETGKTTVYPWAMLRDLAFTYDREYRREFAEHGHICVLGDSTEPFDYTAVSWEKPGMRGMYDVLLGTSLDGLYVHLVTPGGWKARVKVTPGELAVLVEMQGA